MAKITSIDDFAIMANRYERYKNKLDVLSDALLYLETAPVIYIRGIEIDEEFGDVFTESVNALSIVISNSIDKLKNEFSELIQKEYGEENKQ
jgi:hypothetical protein